MGTIINGLLVQGNTGDLDFFEDLITEPVIALGMDTTHRSSIHPVVPRTDRLETVRLRVEHRKHRKPFRTFHANEGSCRTVGRPPRLSTCRTTTLDPCE